MTRPAGPPGSAPRNDATTLSGGLLRVFGVGALIIGDSGIGKSESSLELIARGHKFISDDVVEVRREGRGGLTGRAPLLSRNFMEIRGLGIINIREIFGPGSIAAKSRIDLVVRLKKWRHGQVLDRLGLKLPEDEVILGESVPQVFLPVAPGRNIATLIEVACKVHLLRKKGYHAPTEIMKRLDRALA
jgi:HPr kinase/phosphorylase